ncbi:MAG TPA: glycosyltransferase family 9 protein, partial [Caulobacter sp.]|nr:glycosyltransferase family 9 protein [Caulobacter sp.]
GGPGDGRMVEELRMASARGRYVDLTGKVDLLTAYAALKRADLFIGNDSGLMHIAAAAGVPTIGLFGPSDERRYGPWGPLTKAVRGPRSFEQFLAVDPDLSQAIRHMSDLPVTTVVKAAKALLAEVKMAVEADAEEATVEDAAVTPELQAIVEDVAEPEAEDAVESAPVDPVDAERN